MNEGLQLSMATALAAVTSLLPWGGSTSAEEEKKLAQRSAPPPLAARLFLCLSTAASLPWAVKRCLCRSSRKTSETCVVRGGRAVGG